MSDDQQQSRGDLLIDLPMAFLDQCSLNRRLRCAIRPALPRKSRTTLKKASNLLLADHWPYLYLFRDVNALPRTEELKPNL